MESIIKELTKEVEKEIMNTIKKISLRYKINEEEAIKYIVENKCNMMRNDDGEWKECRRLKEINRKHCKECNEDERNALKKLKELLEEGEKEEKRRGRPKKDEVNNVEKGPRGRPPKEEKMVTTHVGEDLITRLLEKARKNVVK